MVKVLVDTGPLISAIDSRDSAHRVAATLLSGLRRKAVIPSPVLVETDHLARNRVGDFAARRFLQDVAGGVNQVAYLSAGLLRRADDPDRRYADLNLGLADTCVMAIAERHELPILTFDFTDFRATESAAGPWRLAIGEDDYMRAIRQ